MSSQDIGAIKADGLFTVSYASSRLGNIGTGFSLTMVGKEGTLDGKKTVYVEDGLGFSGTLGSEYGITLSAGKSLSRTYKGDMSVVVDPAYDLFGKMIIVSEKESDFVRAIDAHGLNSVRIITEPEARELFIDKLASGDMAGFIDGVLGDTGDVVIDTSKANNSELVKALAGSGWMHSQSTSNAINHFFDFRNVFSVGDFFASIIAPFGLELYWRRDNLYSVEPARLAEGPQENIVEIPDDTIIEYTSSSDLYNAPDLVIPSMLKRDVLGAYGLNYVSKTAMATGLTGVDQSQGARLKITTYDIPNFLVDPVAAAMRSVNPKELEYSGGAAKHTDDNLANTIASFFSSHAMKSTMYRLKTGSCTLRLSPHITEGFEWYKIKGEVVFVSDVRHTITRTSATTTLTIAGKYYDFATNTTKATPDLTKEKEAIKDAHDKGRSQEQEIWNKRNEKKKVKPYVETKEKTGGKKKVKLFMKNKEIADVLKSSIVEGVYPSES